MADFELKKGEAKTYRFTITKDNAVLDVSGDAFSFVVKETIDSTTYLIEKEDADFDKTEATLGIIYITLTTSDMDIDPGTYVAELKSTFTVLTDVDKSETWSFKVDKSVH